ncbi:MAG TPA: ABC transporter ATP-binding protein [Pyrinomonadaceae bacterium]|nr:ABC transporter ATP-binding protein [Pyrinomonadaceae bacterium]
MSPPAFSLVVRDVRKNFRTPSGQTLEVLRGVSLEVAAGEMVAVMGASGAGKTTLLHVAGGLEEADEGDCFLGDFNITRARGRELARFRNERVGFVFQFHHLLPDLTATENAAMPLLINRRPAKEAVERAIAALERVGLAERAEHRAVELSGGEQQRVALARAIISRPGLLLADEPTGNLDAGVGDEIGALLSSICREGATAVLLATHNERLARLCDRVLRLEQGKIEIN